MTEDGFSAVLLYFSSQFLDKLNIGIAIGIILEPINGNMDIAFCEISSDSVNGNVKTVSSYLLAVPPVDLTTGTERDSISVYPIPKRY